MLKVFGVQYYVGIPHVAHMDVIEKEGINAGKKRRWRVFLRPD